MTKHLKYSLLTLVSLFIALPVFIILHNYISGLFRIEEPLFFLLSLLSAFVIPLAFLYLILTLILAVIKKLFRPKFKKSKKR